VCVCQCRVYGAGEGVVARNELKPMAAKLF
jgi:hypothetical protein